MILRTGKSGIWRHIAARGGAASAAEAAPIAEQLRFGEDAFAWSPVVEIAATRVQVRTSSILAADPAAGARYFDTLIDGRVTAEPLYELHGESYVLAADGNAALELAGSGIAGTLEDSQMPWLLGTLS